MSVNEREAGRREEKWLTLYKQNLQLFLYDLFYKNNLSKFTPTGPINKMPASVHSDINIPVKSL